MATPEPQVQPTQQFTDLEYYQFKGDDPTVEKKRRFIEALRLKATVYLAAKAAGIHKATAYEWRMADPQFGQAWDEALEDAGDIMESSTYEEALGSSGKPGNALLKMFWLKAHRPKFRDKVSVDVSEIQERIGQMLSRLEVAQLQQLPATITQFVDTSYSEQSGEYSTNTLQSLQNLDTSDQTQKED